MPVSKSYIYQDLGDTQYHKIVWFLQKIEKGDFQNKNYAGVFLGSSQCYYGVNDSILGVNYLNLGMNTPSRDLDLYLMEELKEAGAKFDHLYVTLGGDQIVSFGFHKIMPFLVSPGWYLSHGQNIYTLHFWKFWLERSQKVLYSVSHLLFAERHSFKTFSSLDFGVGHLNKSISDEKYKELITYKNSDYFYANDAYNHQNQVTTWNEIRYNIRSQWNFFNRIPNARYLYLPSLSHPTTYHDGVRFIKNNHPSFELIYIRDSSSVNGLMKPKYWADPGHLNAEGSIRFTKILLRDSLLR